MKVISNNKGSIIMDLIVGIFIIGIFIYITVSFREHIKKESELNLRNYQIYTDINNKIQQIYTFDWAELDEEIYVLGKDMIQIKYVNLGKTRYNTNKLLIKYYINTDKVFQYTLEKAI